MKNQVAIVGHEEIRALLMRAIVHERLAHAYIFTGPAHVGKTTVAQWLSRAVLCERPTKTRTPCDRCSQCLSCQNGTHPDVTTIGVAEDAREIPIATVRALRSALERTAFMRGYQVAIVTDADAMTTEAANSLLKMLEEPRGKTLIILTATNAYRLLPTIRSRAVTVRFAPVSSALITEACMTWGVSADDTETITVMADGRVGVARVLADDRDARSTRAETLDALMGVLEETGWVSRRRAVETTIEQWKTTEALSLMQGLLRRVVRHALGIASDDRSAVLTQRIARLAARGNTGGWMRSLGAFSSLMETLRTTNVSPLFAWEQFLFTLP